MHYDNAVRGLKTSIFDGSPGEEWKRSTSLLCHAIELLQPSPSSDLARAHLSAAHHMFQLTIGQPGVPHDEHDTLLFEAYIIRTSTNCLFQQDIHKPLPFDYVEKLSAMHLRALHRESLEICAESCPWLSFFGPYTMDMIYKTSWIYAQNSSPNCSSPEAIEVWNTLDRMEEIGDHERHDVQKVDYKITRRIYSTACRALLRPLIPANSYGFAVPEHEALISFGLQDMAAMSQAWSDEMTMLWPLIVLGALSRSVKHQNLCSGMITRFRTPVSAQTVDSVVAFLADAWEAKDEQSCFKDSEALRSILL